MVGELRITARLIAPVPRRCYPGSMNAHVKTCITIASAITAITILCYHPDWAWRLYQAFWVVIAIAFCVCIYGAIYSCFDKTDEEEDSLTYDDV